jgi:hypothetical protein
MSTAASRRIPVGLVVGTGAATTVLATAWTFSYAVGADVSLVDVPLVPLIGAAITTMITVVIAVRVVATNDTRSAAIARHRTDSAHAPVRRSVPVGGTR